MLSFIGMIELFFIGRVLSFIIGMILFVIGIFLKTNSSIICKIIITFY